MARKVMMAGAALAAFALAAPVAAQSIQDDVRCLLAANYFSRAEKDQGKRQLSMAASVFYLGRLDARISNDQLKAAVAAQAKTMSASSVSPIMAVCAKRLIDKGVAIHAFSAGPNGRTPPAPPAKKK